MLDHWGKALDEKFLNTIIGKVDGAPVELFERLVTDKLKGSQKHRSGIMVMLAEDAACAYRTIQAANAQQKPQTQMTDAEYLAWARSLPAEDYAELVERGLIEAKQ
jgi:hypothetical protein